VSGRVAAQCVGDPPTSGIRWQAGGVTGALPRAERAPAPDLERTVLLRRVALACTAVSALWAAHLLGVALPVALERAGPPGPAEALLRRLTRGPRPRSAAVPGAFR